MSFESYMLSFDIINILDGFYFPRFFGSKIMGYSYLILLFFLMFKNKKLFFSQNNYYLFFLILLIFCYLIPLVYGILKTPVIHDRYIIFVLIPIFILISCLINELSSNKLKIFIFIFISSITLSNHYIEIFKRPYTKPQFYAALKNIEKSGINNIVLYAQSDPSYSVGSNLVNNYVENINFSSKDDFNFYQYNKIPKKLKKFWLVCYKPNLVNDCKILDNKYEPIETKKFYQVETYFYKLN